MKPFVRLHSYQRLYMRGNAWDVPDFYIRVMINMWDCP
jgi:hypothetical protein